MTKVAAPHNQHDFLLLFLVMLVIGAGNTALQSVMPAIGRSLHIPDSAIALAFSVSALVWVVAAPFWAGRSDRTGRRQMVLLGVAGFAVSVTLCGVFLTAGIDGWIGPLATISAFVAARVIYGLFGAAAPPAAQAILAGRTTRAERTKALTMLASAFGLGTILGPAFAPFFVLPWVGLAGPAYFFGGCGFVVLVAAWHRLPDDAPNDASRGAASSYPSLGGDPTGASVTAAMAEAQAGPLPLFDRRTWPWLLIGLVMGHAQAMAGQAMGFLTIDRLHLDVGQTIAQQTIGLVQITGAGAALLVQWGLIPRLELSPRTMVIVGLALGGAGLVATSTASSLYGLSLAFALSSAGFGFARPGYTAGSSLAVGPEHQGIVAGRVTSVNGASFVLGPFIGVTLYGAWPPLPYLVAAALCAGSLLYSVIHLPSGDKKRADPEGPALKVLGEDA